MNGDNRESPYGVGGEESCIAAYSYYSWHVVHLSLPLPRTRKQGKNLRAVLELMLTLNFLRKAKWRWIIA